MKKKILILIFILLNIVSVAFADVGARAEGQARVYNNDYQAAFKIAYYNATQELDSELHKDNVKCHIIQQGLIDDNNGNTCYKVRVEEDN